MITRLHKLVPALLSIVLLQACSSVLTSSQPENALQAQHIIRDLGIEKEYPFDHHFLQTDHGRMHYVDEGQGKPVLALHGNPTWSFLYRNFIKGLSDKNRMIAPDLIGFGLSEKPNDVDAYTIAGHIDDIERLVVALDLKDLTLIVQDWGGPIGLAVAARQPHRIKALVIMNTFGSFPPLPSMDENNIDLPFSLDMFRAPLIGNLMVKQLGMFETMGMSMATAKQERLDAVKIAYQDVFTDADDRAGVLAFPQLIPTNLQHPSAQLLKQNVEPYVNNFKGPVQIIWGTQDPFFPIEMLAAWQDRLPQAQIMEVPEASHFLQEDAHEKIIPQLRLFLSNLNNGEQL